MLSHYHAITPLTQPTPPTPPTRPCSAPCARGAKCRRAKAALRVRTATPAHSATSASTKLHRAALGYSRHSPTYPARYVRKGGSSRTSPNRRALSVRPAQKIECADNGEYCPKERSTDMAIAAIQCKVGSYCPDALTEHLCIKGEYCPYSTTAPELCRRGFQRPYPDVQEQCPPFTYSLCDGMQACLPCPPNSAPSYDRTTCICNAG